MQYTIIHNENKVIWIEAIQDTSLVTFDEANAEITREGSKTKLPTNTQLTYIHGNDKDTKLSELENNGIDINNYATNEGTETETQ